MKRYSLNKNWLFHLEDEEYIKSKDPSKKDEVTSFGFFKAGEATGFASRIYKDAAWDKIDLPHDYVVELSHSDLCRSHNGLRPVNDCQHGNETSLSGHADCPCFPIAWYRKEFYLDEDGFLLEEHPPVYGDCNNPAPQNKRYFLQLDGVYRDFIVWVNGVYIDRFTCGYLGVKTDITDQLLFGETNTIAIRVDCSQYDGWWYDGGGIYRDVYLLESSDIYSHSEDIYIHTSCDGRVVVNFDIHNKAQKDSECAVDIIIKDEEREIYKESKNLKLNNELNSFKEEIKLSDIKLWDVEKPNLYNFELYINKVPEQSIAFGFKDVKFTPDKGFFLNGRSLKIKGMCIHQDYPGVGVALTKEMMFDRLIKLKEMGANAIRTVHNPHSPELLNLCDRLGILVMDETRLFGSSPEALRELEALVKRDRNHVSVFIWSLGNEEHTVQSNLWGARMAKTAKNLIQSLCKDAVVSFGGNNGRHFEGINSELELRGINYIRISKRFHPDDYHRDHPHQALFCSEEASVVCTRGCYKTDLEKGVVDSYGYNCAPWGSTPQGYMKFSDERDYFCGAFMWTGYDYRGEPAPFGDAYPHNPMGNFGIMDLCGFPKDIYYYYKAHWTNEPVLHLLPAWDFNEGEEVKVCAFTNCEEIELYLNDKLIEKRSLEKFEIPKWSLKFQAGELKIVGKKENKLISDIRRTAKRKALKAKNVSCGEYTLIYLDAVDEFNDSVNSDCSLLNISCENAEIIGVANGDPTLKTRERYRKNKELYKLPALKGDRALPEFEEAVPKITRDERNERYFDEFRYLWDMKTAPLEEYIFSLDFEADEDYSFLEFSGILGESKIFLDDNEIGTTPTVTSIIRKRPYRFYKDIKKGSHKITVKMNVSKSTHLALEDVYLGKWLDPVVNYPLFHGKMLVIAKNLGDGEVIFKDQKGYTLFTRL